MSKICRIHSQLILTFKLLVKELTRKKYIKLIQKDFIFKKIYLKIIVISLEEMFKWNTIFYLYAKYQI